MQEQTPSVQSFSKRVLLLSTPVKEQILKLKNKRLTCKRVLTKGGASLTKIDETVNKETGYIALWILIFSILMQAVFLVAGRWSYTVLLGNLLSGALGTGNFLLMGLAVQNAVGKEEKEAKDVMKVSQALRTLLLFVVVALGVLLSCFDTVAVIIPLFFPRLAIAIRPLVKGGEK